MLNKMKNANVTHRRIGTPQITKESHSVPHLGDKFRQELRLKEGADS